MKVASYTDLKQGDKITIEYSGESSTFTFFDTMERNYDTYIRGEKRAEVRACTGDGMNIYRHDPVDVADLKKGDRVLVVLSDGTKVDAKVYNAFRGGFDTVHNSYSVGGNGIQKLYLLDRAVPKLTDYVTASAAAMIEEHFTVVPKAVTG